MLVSFISSHFYYIENWYQICRTLELRFHLKMLHNLVLLYTGYARVWMWKSVVYINITLSNFLVFRVTRANGCGSNTKMIPRSFETAASFITRRLIQYHASFSYESPQSFSQDTRRLTYEKVSRRMNGAAKLLSKLLLLLLLPLLLPSLLLRADDRFVLSRGWGHARIYVGIYECLVLFYLQSLSMSYLKASFIFFYITLLVVSFCALIRIMNIIYVHIITRKMLIFIQINETYIDLQSKNFNNHIWIPNVKSDNRLKLPFV